MASGSHHQVRKRSKTLKVEPKPSGFICLKQVKATSPFDESSMEGGNLSSGGEKNAAAILTLFGDKYSNQPCVVPAQMG